jgi:hypothetical protein
MRIDCSRTSHRTNSFAKTRHSHTLLLYMYIYRERIKACHFCIIPSMLSTGFFFPKKNLQKYVPPNICEFVLRCKKVQWHV